MAPARHTVLPIMFLLCMRCSGASSTSTVEPAGSPEREDHQEPVATDTGPVSHERQVLLALIETLAGDVPKRQERAAVALGFVGPGHSAEAVVPLLHAVKTGTLPVQRASVIALGRMGSSGEETLALLVEKLDSGPLQKEAYTALGLIGEGAAPAVPTLTRHLRNALPDDRSIIAGCMGWKVDTLLSPRNDAAWALTSIGAGAAPGLAQAVEESAADEAGKRAACVLVQMGSPAIPHLVGLLESDDAEARFLGASIAGAMDDVQGAGVLQTPLLNLMGDVDARVRREASAAVGALGLCDGETMPMLRGALEDDDVRVQGAAAFSLFECTGETKTTIPALVKNLADDDPEIRIAAAATLGDMGKGAQKAKGPLHKKLDDPDPQVALSVTEAMLKVAPGHKKAVKTLLALCEHSERSIRDGAEKALSLLGPSSKFAVPLLVKKLTTKPDTLAELLKHPGKQGDEPTWPASTLFVQEALVAIGEPSVGPLLDLYGAQKDSFLRSMALDLLGRIGPDAHEAIPVVIESLEHGDGYQRMFGMSVAARIGPGDPRVVEALCALLSDPSEDVRMQALELLGQMGSEASEAAPEVQSLVGGHGRMAVAAAATLRRMGSMDDAAFLQVVRETLEEGNCEQRREATRVLHESKIDAVDLLDGLVLAILDEHCSFDGHLLSLISRPECATDDTIARLMDLVLSSTGEGQVLLYARTLAALVLSPS